MAIAHFAVTRRVAVAMLTAAIIVLGIFAIPRLAVALLPSFAPPVLTVSTTYGNALPQTIESTITRPIENAVSRVSGIDILESNSYQGQSTVRVQFDYGTDINAAAMDVQQQIARIRATLPNDPQLQEPQIIKADPNATPVLVLQVTDQNRSLRDLSDLIVNVLSDDLASVHGVGSVGVSGIAQRAIMIEPDERKMVAVGISLSDLIKRIQNENVDLPAGVIQIGPNEYGIRTNGLYTAPDQISDAILKVANGVPVRLRDLATVSNAIQEQRVFSRINGEPSVQMTITAQPGANVVSLGTDLIGKIHEVERRYPTVHFTTILDQREFILLALRALEHTAFYGAILAVLVILLFLHSWRATIIVALSLPVSILGALFAMYATGESLNVMTLGGLALAVGLIVDDAVVVIENISRFLRKGLTPSEAAEGATTQILGAVIASTVTVVVVFLPLMMIPGQQQLIFSPLALVIMSSVGVSLVVAVLTVPMLSAELLRRKLGSEASGRDEPRASFAIRFETLYAKLEARYRRALAFCIDRPRIVLAVSGALLVATLLIVYLGVVPTEIFPPSDSRFIEFNLQAPNGTALNVMNKITRTVENALLQDPRVQAVGSVTGQAGNGSNARSLTNRSNIQIAMQPGTSGPAAARFVNDWRARLNGPTAGQGVPDGAALRTAMIGTTARGQTVDIVQRQISQHQTALELEIFGPNVDRLQSIADGVMVAISTIPGVGDPDKNVTVSQPEVDVMVDRTRLMMSGLGTGDLAQLLSTATNGTIASYYQINGIQYPIIIELPPNERRSFSSLQGLEFMSLGAVPSPNGAPMLGTLGNVATLTTTYGPSAISRQDRQRRVEIGAPISGRPLGPILTDAAHIMNHYALPQGYRWEYGPEIQRGETSFNALWLAVGLAVILIYMLLAAQFESYVDPLVIITAVPFSIVGIVAALLITHRAFGLPAFVGTLMLVGICVKNSILVIEFTKQLREEGLDAREALLRAGPIRLRPILMTSMATVGGMLPLALGIEAGSSTQAPLATVVIGGLIASTFLSLLVVPTLYLWITQRFGGRFISRRRAPSTAKEFQSVLGSAGEQTTTEIQTGLGALEP